MEVVFGVLAAALIMFGHIVYAKDAIKGRVRPQRATWTVIEVISLVTIANQVAADASYSLIPWVGSATTGTFVFILALAKGTGGFGWLDITVVIVSMIGITFWIVSDNERNSIIATPVAIVLAVTPTILKALRDPHSENLSQWLSSFIGASFIMLSVGKLDFDQLVIPATWFLATGSISLIVFLWTRSSDSELFSSRVNASAQRM